MNVNIYIYNGMRHYPITLVQYFTGGLYRSPRKWPTWFQNNEKVHHARVEKCIYERRNELLSNTHLRTKLLLEMNIPQLTGAKELTIFPIYAPAGHKNGRLHSLGKIVYWKVVFPVFTYVIHLDQSDAYVIYSVFPFQVLDQTHDPPDTAITTVLKSVSLVIIIAAGLLENACVISTIVKDKKLHRAPYYYMINLSVADLLRSIFCLPIILSTVLQVCMNYIIKYE